MLLQVARCMFPEGKGRPVAAPKVSSAAPLINQLLYNTEAAIDKLWKERGYDPMEEAGGDQGEAGLRARQVRGRRVRGDAPAPAPVALGARAHRHDHRQAHHEHHGQ